MDVESGVSGVRRSESGRDDLRPGATEAAPVIIRELKIESVEDIKRLLALYESVDVPKDPGNVFLEHLVNRRDSWFVEVGDIGLVYFTGIIPEFTSTMHVIFWDQKLGRGRVPYVKNIVRSAFELFALRKINVVTIAKPMQEFLKDVGFQWEGKIRRGTIVNGEMKDVRLFGIIPEEI